MSKKKIEFERAAKLVENLKHYSTEKLLELRNIYNPHKDNRYWRKAVNDILRERGINVDKL